jgi:hypothetical protein
MANLAKNRAVEINKLHNEVCEGLRTTIGKAIKIGELLKAQKRECNQGAWIPWMKANLKFSDRTANRYMRCYENRRELNPPQMADLTFAEIDRMLAEPKPKRTRKVKVEEDEEDPEIEAEIDAMSVDDAKKLADEIEEEDKLLSEVPEERIVELAAKTWKLIYLHYLDVDKKRVAKAVVKMLFKKYPQLMDEAIES